MKADVTLGGEASELVEEGKLVLIGIVLYDVQENAMRVLYVGNEEEGSAMLRKFKMLPGPEYVRKAGT